MKSEPAIYDSMTTPFADGFMGQNPDQRNGENIGQFSRNFGEGLAKEKEFSEEEKLVRQRAKKAGRIYRKVCEDLRLDACFFSNFVEWTEYVEGRMSDDEFHGRALMVAQKMRAALN
ncbi:MAG: hypothetical protein P4L43_11945 [Syntrophobacteraceae bacterium]|nr:hypothetical protein [Syntrophobacteraceae bacterium]